MIKAAPYSFAIAVVVVCLIVGGLIWLFFKERLDRHKEEIEHLERELGRVKKNPVSVEQPRQADCEPEYKLTIHKAVYGNGPLAEISVTDKLQKAVRDALVITVDGTLGGLLQRDPAFGYMKRLDVEYSYGSDTTISISRQEYPQGKGVMRLVLPEDSEVERLNAELISIRALFSPLEERAFSVAKEVCSLLKDHGSEPRVEDAKKHGIQPIDWHYEKIQPWRDGVAAAYRTRLAGRVQRIRDELAEQGLRDSELDAAIGTRLYTEEDMRKIAQRLRFVASYLGF